MKARSFEKKDFCFNLRFPGQYYDSETGFYYNFHRYYMPEVGRYLREDEVKSDYNLYIYVEDNPVLKVDSYGLVANSEGWLPWGYSYRWYHWYYTKYGVLIYIYPSRKCECEAGGKFGWIQRYENIGVGGSKVFKEWCPDNKPGFKSISRCEYYHGYPIYDISSIFSDTPIILTKKCFGTDFVTCSVCIYENERKIEVLHCFKWGIRISGNSAELNYIGSGNFNKNFWESRFPNWRWIKK